MLIFYFLSAALSGRFVDLLIGLLIVLSFIYYYTSKRSVESVCDITCTVVSMPLVHPPQINSIISRLIVPRWLARPALFFSSIYLACIPTLLPIALSQLTSFSQHRSEPQLAITSLSINIKRSLVHTHILHAHQSSPLEQKISSDISEHIFIHQPQHIHVLPTKWKK